MSEEPIYDIATRVAALKKLNERTQDGLKLLRLIGPELNPEYNDQVGVAKCQTPEQMVAENNRGGKTMLAAAKVAACARDVPLIAWDGEKIDCRLPHHKGYPLTIWNVGAQFRHIGETMFRLLFEPGAFRVITDPDTGALRSYQPWLEWDYANRHRCQLSPPLIPPSAIDQDTWVWENKGAKQLASVQLKNGTSLKFYPSTGDVKKGDPVHVIWIDELIQYSEHYPEWIARLTDYEGFLLWSTMIYRKAPAILRVMERAELQQEEVERGDRKPKDVITKVFKFKPSGNPYLPKARLDVNREIFESEGDDVVAQRLDGGSIFDNTLIYPFFSKQTHSAIPDNKNDWDDLSHALDALGGLPPKDWTHELIIDPGAQKPAVLFFATPPALWKDATGKEWSLWPNSRMPSFVPYDEIYGRRYSLKELVPLIKEKMRGIRFRRFIMDMQGGRISSMTGGPSASSLFTEAFAQNDIISEETGPGFIAGGTDFPGRKRIVESWMQIQNSGKPQLRIVHQRCPNLVWQLTRNQLATDGDQVVIDKEARRERNDLRVSLEYAASRGPKYVNVPQIDPLPNWYEKAMEHEDAIFKSHQSRQERCHFGPGVAP